MAPKHAPRWRFWHNFLVGLPWDRWRVLRAENRVEPGFRHRAAFLTLLSLRNAAGRRKEERDLAAALAAAPAPEPPLFILGHWRSGTTLLHDLLAQDTEQFAFPTSAQVTYPFTFFTAEATLRKLGAVLPRTRPQDNVAIGMDTPQEDEFALCAACQHSPYLGMFTFPQRAAHYDRYLTLQDVSEKELAEWKGAFRWFMRKLTLRYGRPLLLKSPTHTARIRLLLELFPGARFVHIHRDPYAVFQSTRHLYPSLWAINQMQKAPGDLDAQILRRYTTLHDAFFAQVGEIPAGRFHQIRYEELAQDPVGQLRETYERLGLHGFEGFRPRLQQYVESLAGYRKNAFGELDPTLRRQIAQAWGRSFEVWAYPR